MLTVGSASSSRLDRILESSLLLRSPNKPWKQVMEGLAYSLRIAGHCWHCITAQKAKYRSRETMAVWPSELRLA